MQYCVHEIYTCIVYTNLHLYCIIYIDLLSARGMFEVAVNGILIFSSQLVHLVRKMYSPAVIYRRVFESKWRSFVSTRQFLVFPRIIYYRT